MMIIFRAPYEYLSEGATDKQKETITLYRKLLDEISNGVRDSIILPSNVDEVGNRLFDIEVINTSCNSVQFKPSGAK